jgi:hypothetical protein
MNFDFNECWDFGEIGGVGFLYSELILNSEQFSQILYLFSSWRGGVKYSKNVLYFSITDAPPPHKRRFIITKNLSGQEAELEKIYFPKCEKKGKRLKFIIFLMKLNGQFYYLATNLN